MFFSVIMNGALHGIAYVYVQLDNEHHNDTDVKLGPLYTYGRDIRFMAYSTTPLKRRPA